MSENGWSPLLEGKPARRAESVIGRLVVGLPELDWEEVASSREQPLYQRGLAGGAAGQALFWAYLARCRDDEDAAERAVDGFERAAAELAEIQMDASLYGGIAGVGFVGEHLTGFLFEAEDEDPLEDIDEALLEHLAADSWHGQYDLVSGLVGLGVYALERWPRPAARRAVERIVEHLAGLAITPPEGGLAWHTPPELLPSHQREICPQGYLNLGVAHGVPGVIGFLAGACRAGTAAEQARELLDGAVAWLLAQRLSGERSLFPNFRSAERQPEPSRLAWCYGDPGIAATLYAAARAVEHEGWQVQALDIARTAARRTLEVSGVQDQGLCHGTAGLGHLWNRLYQASGDEVCREAARYWFDQTLLEVPGEWKTGIPTVRPHPGGRLERVEETALLTGASGVGLALLAALFEVEPEWDRILLLSSRGPGGEA